jgi:hypothetical protein
MFVTSDIFDLRHIGNFRKFEWRENLLCGVVVYGTQWRGYQADAAFLLEASRRRGLLQEMKYAGYDRPSENRTRNIAPKSFERLVRGELAGAKTATGLLFRGERPTVGAQDGDIDFGGDSCAGPRYRRTVNGPVLIVDYPYRAFETDFLFPLTDAPAEDASELLRLAVDLLDAEYGYYFVRDQLCFPMGYAHGLSAPLDWGPLSFKEGEEVSGWRDFEREGSLWTGAWPLLRDLFQVNLLSDRHTSVAIEGLGYLAEWIVARPGRGRLDDLGRGRLLWTLTDAEMFNVRPLLNRAGLLFSCRDRVYRDLPGGPANTVTS